MVDFLLIRRTTRSLHRRRPCFFCTLSSIFNHAKHFVVCVKLCHVPDTLVKPDSLKRAGNITDFPLRPSVAGELQRFFCLVQQQLRMIIIRYEHRF
jgi:hypothetical protein